MKIVRVSYRELSSDRNDFSNHAIEATSEVESGETPGVVLMQLKNFVRTHLNDDSVKRDIEDLKKTREYYWKDIEDLKKTQEHYKDTIKKLQSIIGAVQGTATVENDCPF